VRRPTVRNRRSVPLEQSEDRVALSGAVHLQGATFEIVLSQGPPVFVQASGVLTPSGRLNVKLDRSIPTDTVIPSDPTKVLLLGGRDGGVVREFTGFVSNGQIHAGIPGDPTAPPPVT
jgi:hypothetical protein